MVNYTKHQHISSSNTTTTADGVKDGVDKIHTGIIKALELAAAGTAVLEYGASVFQQTAGTSRTQFGVSGAIKYMREGLVITGTPTAVELTADPDVTNDRYDMIVIQSSDDNFAVRVGTAATTPRVADSLTAGDVPVALIKVSAGAPSTNNATSREVQLFGFDKTSNSLSIGYSDSGVYTEAGSITGSANGLLYASGLTTVGAVLTMATNEPSVVNNDVLGRINFQAPLDTGADSDLVGASIAAVAQDTFSDTVNSTALIFQTGKSETATTKMTIDEDGAVTLAAIAACGSDTDKFLVSDSGEIKFRTGAEVRSDIGAGTSSVAALNDLSDVSYSSGDLTITSLDKVVFANTGDAELSVATTTSTTAGRDLTIAAGSTTTGANNIAGGDLILKSGGGDGTGTSTMSFHTKVSGVDTVAERMKINATGNLELTGTDIILGGDSDADKKITFGHATLKSVIGIDDDSDVFAINTDDAFEAVNDLEIDAAGNVTLGNGGLTLTGGDIGVTGGVTASTNVMGTTGVVSGGFIGVGGSVRDASSVTTILSTHSQVYVHTSSGTNNELVLPIITGAASGTVSGSTGRLYTIKNVDTADTIIISVGGSDKLDNDSLLHPMVYTTGKIHLKPNESVTVIATSDFSSPLVPGYYIIDSVGVGLDKKTIWVPAAAMYPNTTNGCSALTQVELSNGPELKCLDFDASATEYAQFTVAFPKSWDGGTVSFKAYWCSTATDTDGVSWGLSACGMNDNETTNLAFGTEVVVDDANQGAANELLITAESNAITIAGTPAAEDLTFFQISRDHDDGNDTAAEDARLLGIKLYYTVNAGNDI